MSGQAGGAGPRLVGVGMGPGDPELVTVKAVRVLREADLVMVPVMDSGERGRAESTVLAHVRHDRIRRVPFAFDAGDDRMRREAAWDAAADAVAGAFAAGAAVVAFATIGDPNLYSTFAYLSAGARRRVAGLTVETVPGVTAMQDLAARAGVVLCEGRESLAVLPLTAGVDKFRAALAAFDAVVGYKSGARLPEVLSAVRDAGRLDGAVHGAWLGLPGQDIRPAAEVAGPAPYLSTLIVPPARSGRGSAL